jgi:geranylgeranylglycerol-phosphate geranylgeranyltransferase
LVGAWIGQRTFVSLPLLIAGGIGFIVCAFGNVVNDLKDIEIDRINNPNRPLPSARAGKRAATVLAVVLGVLSVAGAILLGTWPFLTVIAALFLLFLYSAYLKRTMAGNFTVAFIAGLSFLLGGLVAHNTACVIPFVFSIFIHLPREIVKDILDMKGDQAIGAVTLPIIAGPFRACNLSASLLIFLCLLLPLPYFLGILKIGYMIVILGGAYPIILYVIWHLFKRPGTRQLQLVSNLIKAAMGAGLIAMIIS